ncbi:MAG: DUF3291 domain-containing protein [Cyclobacteriaceae bacterium]
MYHLAEINIGKLRYPIDHPQIAEFAENLDRINEIAEKSPGFVWRLQDESGNATEFHPFGDPLIIVNMSVWEGIEELKQYAFQTEHVQFMRKRQEWFEKHVGAYLVMWWVPTGHRPTIDEAKKRLSLLQAQGDTPEAFTFKKIFDPPSAKV